MRIENIQLNETRLDAASPRGAAELELWVICFWNDMITEN